VDTWKTLGWSAICTWRTIAASTRSFTRRQGGRRGALAADRAHHHPGILPTFFVLLLLQISNIVNNGMEQYLVFQNA
jgi:ABC-type polysaccharide transport system permease subunit